MQIIRTSLQTDSHASTSSFFLRAGCSSWHPTNSVKALKVQGLGWPGIWRWNWCGCWNGRLVVWCVSSVRVNRHVYNDASRRLAWCLFLRMLCCNVHLLRRSLADLLLRNSALHQVGSSLFLPRVGPRAVRTGRSHFRVRSRTNLAFDCSMLQ